MALLLRDVEKGEKVLVYCYMSGRETATAKLQSVSQVMEVLKTRCRVSGYGAFSLYTGERIDGSRKFFIRRATEDELAAAQRQLDAEVERAEQEAEAKRKAEYDALPEAVKLAKKLEWFCNVNRTETIAKMPLETLRAAVAWIESNNLECE